MVASTECGRGQPGYRAGHRNGEPAPVIQSASVSTCLCMHKCNSCVCAKEHGCTRSQRQEWDEEYPRLRGQGFSYRVRPATAVRVAGSTLPSHLSLSSSQPLGEERHAISGGVRCRDGAGGDIRGVCPHPRLVDSWRVRVPSFSALFLTNIIWFFPCRPHFDLQFVVAGVGDFSTLLTFLFLEAFLLLSAFLVYPSFLVRHASWLSVSQQCTTCITLSPPTALLLLPLPSIPAGMGVSSQQSPSLDSGCAVHCSLLWLCGRDWNCYILGSILHVPSTYTCLHCWY